MQRLGFIHDMMDVKVLILYVTARSKYPMTAQEVYEVCYQDECLSYFDVCAALPQMVETGHLQIVEEERYIITDKGRADGSLMEDSIAFTVRQRAEDAVARFNHKIHRGGFVKTQIVSRENGEFTVTMSLDDETGNLMTLSLLAPNQRQAIRIGKVFEKKAETLYNLTMAELLDNTVNLDD